MLIIVGAIVVIVTVMGGYVGNGGEIGVLIQPFEFLIILGAAAGGALIGNPRRVLTAMLKSFGTLMRGSKRNKAGYLELLSLLYSLFRLAKTKGDLALESHVEKPEESTLFQKFPGFSSDHHVRDFLCDYLRLLTLGTHNAHEVEAIIDEEIDAHHHESAQVSDAVTNIADGLPALGIVAAVLGVIHTMGSITVPPEVLGHLIGGALVGTFSGVLFAYGFVGPIGRGLVAISEAETEYYKCIKSCLLAHMMGYAPQVSIEFGRKTLSPHVRPNFKEVEETVGNLAPD